MVVKVGDRIVVEIREGRRAHAGGRVLEVTAHDIHTEFRVRWDDGHVSEVGPTRGPIDHTRARDAPDPPAGFSYPSARAVALRASNPRARAWRTVSGTVRRHVNAVAIASQTAGSSQYALCDVGKSLPEWTRRSTTLASPSRRRNSGSATNERKSRLS